MLGRPAARPHRRARARLIMQGQHGARRVDPHLIFGISLFAALVLSWPSLAGAMHGEIDIVQAGIRLLIALAISWAGCYAVGSLVYGYAQSAPSVGTTAPADIDATAAIPQRRVSDVVVPTFEAGALTPGLEVVEVPDSPVRRRARPAGSHRGGSPTSAAGARAPRWPRRRPRRAQAFLRPPRRRRRAHVRARAQASSPRAHRRAARATVATRDFDRRAPAGRTSTGGSTRCSPPQCT